MGISNFDALWMNSLSKKERVGSGRRVVDIDLDGVCANYVDGLRRFVATERKLDPNSLPEPDTYNIAKATGWPFTDVADFLATHRRAVENHLYLNLEPYPGVAEAFRELDDEHFHIRVVTHRLILSGLHQQVVTETASWLEENGLLYMSLCFVGPKDTMRASVHVEDSPSNITSLRDVGEHVIVFDQPYNRDIDGPRAHSWSEVVQIIKQGFGGLGNGG